MARIKNNGMIITTESAWKQYMEGKLETLIVPEGVTSITSYAFYYGKITKAVLPNTIVSISDFAFQYSTITEINLPDGLTTLKGNCFASTNLRKIIVPASVTSIGQAVFSGQGKAGFNYIIFKGNSPISIAQEFRYNSAIRLFDIRNRTSVADLEGRYDPGTSVPMYINVPDALYDAFVALPNFGKLTQKHFVHSCDVTDFNEISNPVEGDYYSLKGDMNYLNPIGQKQLEVKQYTAGGWVDIDIG